MTRLDFIVGGVQKAGTSTLVAYLSDHPRLLGACRKELHHFDDESLDWSRPDIGLPDNAFPPSATGQLRFEATPITLFWPRALDRVQRHNPEIKVILIFRDPIERAHSQWRMEVDRGDETLSFGMAIREGRARLHDGAASEYALRHFSYVERGFYGRQLRVVFDLFSREQLLLLLLDDLAADHRPVLDRIARFLGIAKFPPTLPRHERQGTTANRGIPAVDEAYLREIFRDDTADFAWLSGLPVDNWRTMAGVARNPS